MTRSEYLQQLRAELKSLPPLTVEDIVRDYDEHFGAALAAGKSEAEIAKRLGAPATLARTHLANEQLARAERSPTMGGRLSALWAAAKVILILAPFNLIFMFFPFLFGSLIFFGAWILALGGLGTMLSTFGRWLVLQRGLHLAWSSNLSFIFLLLAVVGLSVIGVLIMAMVTRLVLKWLIEYFRWNIRFVTKKG